MNKPGFSKSFVANTVTSLNAFCGFLSILYTSQHDFKSAAVFIIAAAVFDTLDGIVARLLGTTSRFGVELDSLSDVVSFGAAPAFLVYKAYAFQFGFWGILLSSSLLIFGALRLARFNIQLDDLTKKGDFKGLPIPLQAITIATLVLSYHSNGGLVEPFNIITLPLIILLAGLMVSKIRYSTLPNLRDRNLKQIFFLFVTLLVTLALVILTNGRIVFYIFLSIILFGIFRYLYYLVLNKKNNLENDINTPEK